MTILYFLGANDSHRYEGDSTERHIHFHKADDEPFPYAHVSATEAADLVKEYPALYGIKATEIEAVGGQDDGQAAKPVKKPAADKKAKAPKAEKPTEPVQE